MTEMTPGTLVKAEDVAVMRHLGWYRPCGAGYRLVDEAVPDSAVVAVFALDHIDGNTMCRRFVAFQQEQLVRVQRPDTDDKIPILFHHHHGGDFVPASGLESIIHSALMDGRYENERVIEDFCDL